MPKRKSAANKRFTESEQDQSPPAESTDNSDRKRILYTRSAKDAAKEKILRCFQPKSDPSGAAAKLKSMDKDDDEANDEPNEGSSETVSCKRPRSRFSRDPVVEPPSSRRLRLEVDDIPPPDFESMANYIRRTNELDRSLSGHLNPRRLIPSFFTSTESNLARPMNVFHSYRQLLVEVPLNSRRTVPSSLSERLSELLNSLESSPAPICSTILSEICQFLLLNNEDTLPNFPSRHFVAVMAKFLPPYQDNQCEANAIIACRALSCVCEVLPSSVGAVARAVPSLINCLSKFTAVDVPEQALSTLETLARQHQARAILLNNGVALSLKIFDFLSSSAVLSVLTIISQCAAVVRPSSTEFKLILPFLEFAERGLALQDAKLSQLVCSAVYRLTVNLRLDSSIFKKIAENNCLVSTLKDMLSTGHWTNFVDNKFLLVRTLCAMCAGSPRLVNEMLRSLPDVPGAVFTLFMEGFDRMRNIMARNPYDAKNTEEELLDLLTLVDVFIPSIESEKDSFFEEDVFCQRSNCQVVWQWKDDNNGWQSYNVTECWIIEAGYFSNLDEVSLQIDSKNYAIDFEQMLQINEETGTGRCIQRMTDDSGDKTIGEHAVVERIIEATCSSIYDLSNKSNSPLLSQRCWTLLVRMLVYVCQRRNVGLLQLPNMFRQFEDIGASLYSLLTSDCPLLVVCALKTVYALLKCCARSERSALAKQFIADGVVEALESLSENEQSCRRRSTRNRHVVNSMNHLQANEPPVITSFSSLNYERLEENSFASGLRNIVRGSRMAAESQSRVNVVPSDDMRAPNRHNNATGRQNVEPQSRIPTSTVYKWIKSRAAQILSQFKDSFNRNDSKLEALRNVCQLISKEADEKLLRQLAKMISQDTSVFQMSKSSSIKTMLDFLRKSDDFDQNDAITRLQLFINAFTTQSNALEPSPLLTLVRKLNACVEFTEKFTSNNDTHVLPFSGDRSSMLHAFGNGVLVSFVELKTSTEPNMTTPRIGPVMCTHATRVTQIIPTLSYYLSSFMRDGHLLLDIYDSSATDIQSRLELYYEGRKLQPDDTIGSILNQEPLRSVQLQYRMNESSPKEVYRTESYSNPQSWLLALLDDKDCSLNDPSTHSVRLIRLIALLCKHQHLIGHNFEIPDSTFINWKLSATALRILRDPVRLVSNEPCPRWLRCLSYECFPLFPFELRQMAFYALNYPHSRLLNRFAELGLLSLSHGLEHYGRMEKKRVIIRRDRILSSAEDIFSKLQPMPMLEISYENEIGHGNGPTHEFYALVGKELRQCDIWAVHTENSLLLGLIPSPLPGRCGRTLTSRIKTKFRFIGKLIAKCILDFKMLDLPLNVVVYKWLLRQEQSICLDDLKYVDPDLFRQLRRLDNMALDKELGRESRSKIREYEKEVDSLCLDFTLPGYPDIEMVKNGRNKGVGLDNAREFIKFVVDWRLVEGIRRQMEAMRDGFQSIMKLSWLRCFHADELHLLVCGNQHDEWDLELLRKYTKCDHGYSHNSEQIKWLFTFMCSLDCSERRLFLQFITGTPCLPVGGIKCLNPLMTIVKSTDSNSADEVLPSVMTCKNYLKLPAYSKFEVLQSRFRLAMSEGQESFHLS